MDSIRLFFRSNSFRKSKPKDQYLRTDSNSSEIIDLIIENQSDQSSSSEKIKSFLSTHPPTTTSLRPFPKLYFELETCSGLSIPITEHPGNTLIAASASESISNARSFTNHHRRSSILSNKRRRSWTAVHNHHHHPISPIRRTKSYRYPDRIRKHSKGKVIRHHSQVNS
jgi:hypothetical protein